MVNLVEKQAYKIAEFCAAYGVGRTKFYEEVAKKRIKVFKLGRLTLISKDEANNWLQRCQAESETGAVLMAGGAR